MFWHIVPLAGSQMNNPDFYIYIFTALLPLSACMVVFQVNPYHALALRGILGAVAAMLYAVLGAADVSLTEALMGTMLAITLYAIAVRSSLVLRLGVLEDHQAEENFEQLLADFRSIFDHHYMRLEVVPYNNMQALQRALSEKEVHATCVPGDEHAIHTTIRVKRIYEILQAELAAPGTSLSYVSTPDLSETPGSTPNLGEQQI
jgi:putative multicomponent Na+:H+ antiporter subunit B